MSRYCHTTGSYSEGQYCVKEALVVCMPWVGLNQFQEKAFLIYYVMLLLIFKTSAVNLSMNHTHSYFAQDAVLDLHEILIIAIPNTRKSTCPTRTLTFPKPTFPVLNTQCCIFSPANGMVVMAGNLVGNTATYSCNSGFELVGAQTVTLALSIVE